MKQKFYAVKAKEDDIRRRSSSGGGFMPLARYIIGQNGIVYGAVYDSNLKVIHTRITTETELYKLHGSKYVQSNMKNNFELIKQDICEGRIVLFSGTPCQVSSLKTYLFNCQINTTNLFTVDLICHGTPDPIFFEEYKKYLENKYHSKITAINMRYKSEKRYFKNLNRPHSNYHSVKETMCIDFENGKRYIRDSAFDIYFCLFDKLIKRGCFHCPFSNLERYSDITIGDFHEFSSGLGNFNDGNGVSLVIINSIKGNEIFSFVQNEFYCEKKEVQQCLQPNLQHPTNKPNDYEDFQTDYKENGFEYVIKNYRDSTLKYKLKFILYKFRLFEYFKMIKFYKK